MVSLIQDPGVLALAGGRPAATAIAAVFGLVIGSFLNVVVYRVPRGLSVARPGSFCPSCSAPVRGYDNVPVVSWVVLRGRCRHCGAPISVRYPVVELATAVVFAAVAWALGPHWAVPGTCVLAATALAVAAIELDGELPPPELAWIGAGLGLALLAVAAGADRRWWHLDGALIGAALVTGIAVAASRRRAGRAAVPRIWALLPAAVVVGWTGWPGVAAAVPATVVATFVVGWSRAWARRQRGGLALAAAIGAAVAVVVTAATGGSIGL
ncbi:MAG TPA: prepilin peptidase [Acidimicrobiales bacterium]|nr:prepilin peptidase [Acidimicrobiales bacterium]